tara:strand:+ start:80 stop:298 length:219 start_codon:yes stop_codon:yes gene_type:complete
MKYVNLMAKETLVRKQPIKAVNIERDVFSLNLHEREWYSGISKDVLKVPGGFIYSDWDSELGVTINPVFVPK